MDRSSRRKTQKRNLTPVDPAPAQHSASSALAVKTPEAKRLSAEAHLSTALSNTITAWQFRGRHPDDLGDAYEVTLDKIEAVKRGDLSGTEAILVSQALALDTMFNDLSRRSHLNMGNNIDVAETYLRLAMKAQAQCRTSIETLMQMKNPPGVMFARQANISNGPQQVNNTTPAARAEDFAKSAE